jgi:transposase
VITATKTAMRSLGRRVLALDEEMATIDALLGGLVAATAPILLEVHGIGVDTAATLLVAAGDNPGRLRSEAAWAHLCGVAPIPASSGKVTRWRLNRGGDRQANGALWVVVINPHELRPAHPRLRRTPPPRRPLEVRDHPHPQALRRPRGLPPPPSQLITRSSGPGSIIG